MKVINGPITWFRYYCHEPHNLAITVTFKYILNMCDSMKRVIHVHIDTGKNPNNIHVTTFKYYPYWEIFVGDQ